jgi:hypothetical protein
MCFRRNYRGFRYIIIQNLGSGYHVWMGYHVWTRYLGTVLCIIASNSIKMSRIADRINQIVLICSIMITIPLRYQNKEFRKYVF